MSTTVIVGGSGVSTLGVVGQNIGVVGQNIGIVGHNVGLVGVNDSFIYQHGTVVTLGHPLPYSGHGQVGHYPPPYTSQPTGTITMTPAAVIITQNLGSKPLRTFCKSCNADTISRVEKHPIQKTHFFALALCLVCCWPCAVIPYCLDDCLGADHYCSNCNSYIGSHNK